MEHIIKLHVTVTILCLSFTLALHGDLHSDCDIPLLNGTMFNVLDQYFNATGSLDDEHAPDQVVFNGQGWCTNKQGYNAYDPGIEVRFGAEVRVNKIQIGAINSTSYVTKIRIQGCNINGTHCTDNGITPLDTLLNNTTARSDLINLTSPVIGRTIKILPVEWSMMTQSPCLYIELYGCFNNPICKSVREIIQTNMSSTVMFQSPVVIISLVFPSENNQENISFNNNSVVYKDFTGNEVFNFLHGIFTFWSPPLYVDKTLNISGLNLGEDNTVTVYGCDQNNTNKIEPSVTSSSLVPTSTVIIEKDYLILEAGIPLASLTVGIVALLILCGTLNAYNIKKQAKNKIHSNKFNGSLNLEESKETTLKKVDNELYCPPESPNSISNNIPYAAFIEPLPPRGRPQAYSAPTSRGYYIGINKTLEKNDSMSKTYESINN